MNLRITPPTDFSFEQCYRHLKQVVRTRVKHSTLRRTRHGYFIVSGPVPDLVMIKTALAAYDYQVTT